MKKYFSKMKTPTNSGQFIEMQVFNDISDSTKKKEPQS